MNGKDVATENEHPRPTTATIDRRVERLELAQQETDRKLDALTIQVGFIKDLMDLKFGGLEATINAQGQKLDTFMVRIDTLISEAQKNAGDLRAQPLGRQIDDRLKAVEEMLKDHDTIIDETRGFGMGFRQYIFPGIALIVSVVSILVAMGHV